MHRICIFAFGLNGVNKKGRKITKFQRQMHLTMNIFTIPYQQQKG